MCEGEVTEPEYFAFVRDQLKEHLISIVALGDLGDPLSVVEEAIMRRKNASKRARQAKDENLTYDEIWCVVDVDDHARLPEAKNLAKKEGINLAVSNPCFELWALLHFQEQNAHINSIAIQRRLRSHMPGYEKSLRCDAMVGAYTLAKQRAMALEKQHERNMSKQGSNPSTDVWKLVDKILESASKARPGKSGTEIISL
ncbi:RloB-like protein [Saccharothrix texasensis]|uniref:RloB-like protein n=1 Tax=Saccharothrix texasensis TaxID=103734 RepID=A0A3N1HD18_9PSEU|nr:RloB-like protein [Saccharothrix texasensis]